MIKIQRIDYGEKLCVPKWSPIDMEPIDSLSTINRTRLNS